MMSNPLILFLGVLIGALLSSQGAINGRLAFHLGGPMPAAVVSFSVGLTALLLVSLAARQPLPTLHGLKAAPWWALTGGLLGAMAVASAAAFIPKVGVATWIAAAIAGQLTGALILDHVGAFGLAVRTATPSRVLGVLFLAFGVWLIQRGGR